MLLIDEILYFFIFKSFTMMSTTPFKNFQSLTNQVPFEQLKMIKGGDGNSGGEHTTSTVDAEEDER